ncbi:hypothetical protein L6R50_04660 [Myxococcota bacterium]|nr:hypothetical protein [Myxococcota bacterium]
MRPDVPRALVCAALLSWACGPDPERPARVAYDFVACAECGMLVSDPRYASQAAPRAGGRRFYDDPACLFRDVAGEPVPVERAWFHDARTTDDVWIAEGDAAFLTGFETPMGSGLGAVPRGTPGAISLEEARAVALGERPR